MHTHHSLYQLPPPLRHMALQGHAPLTVGGEMLLATLILILVVGGCSLLAFIWEVVAGVVRWSARMVRQRMPKEADHE
ncbi:MAG: hypothetical protein ACYCXX_11295 [Acidiferrobacter thiooxydans]